MVIMLNAKAASDMRQDVKLMDFQISALTFMINMAPNNLKWMAAYKYSFANAML